jgi:hypothetical protein
VADTVADLAKHGRRAGSFCGCDLDVTRAVERTLDNVAVTIDVVESENKEITPREFGGPGSSERVGLCSEGEGSEEGQEKGDGGHSCGWCLHEEFSPVF